MINRIVRILELLVKNRKVKVTMLAEMLDVSQVTLRRDLDMLEKRGIICRLHGYASLDGADETAKKLALFHSIKQRIAKAAAEKIEDGETVMIESGSCCALLAEEIVLAKKNVTIVTNSLFIKNYINNLPGLKLILLSGYLQPESQVLVGPLTIKSSENIFTDKFFLGTNGYIAGHAFTGRDLLCAETAFGLAKQANKVFILTESAKFKNRGAYSLLRLDNITGIFTDDKIPKEAEDTLIKNNVQLYKVPFAEEIIRWCNIPGYPPFLYREKAE